MTETKQRLPAGTSAERNMARPLGKVGARSPEPGARTLVLAIGHFPPPLHGMALATDRFVALLAEQADVRRLVISGGARPGMRYHMARAARTAAAVASMTWLRRRSGSFYLGSDAGRGMAYTLAIIAAGRALRYRCFLHHHSAAYVNDRSAVMSAIVRTGGRRCTHLLYCEGQAKTFEDRYRPVRPSMLVPISFALEANVERSDAEATRSHGSTLVLGHLSNLSVEKGLVRAFQTLDSARKAGLDARLLLAGPPATSRDGAVLDALLATHPQARYIGSVDGRAKQLFFAGIDVFLFPTRYRHESFGLVAAEAMQAGIPVIVYRAGCLDREFVGEGGLVLDPSEDFVAEAVGQLRRWASHPDELRVCATRARSRSRSASQAAMANASTVIEHVLRPTPTRRRV